MIGRHDEHGRGELATPDCPYCEQPIDGETVNYGGGPMHKRCWDKFGEEMATAFPGELQPIDESIFTDALDPDYCQPEDGELLAVMEQQDDETPF